MSILLSALSLADVTSKDTALDTFVETVLHGKEVSRRAPAELCIFLREDYSDEQLAMFADPGSRQKDGTWGELRNKAKVGANELPGFIWDHKYSKSNGETITGDWYRDYVDGTAAGRRYNTVRDACEAHIKGGDAVKGAPSSVNDEGNVINLGMMDTDTIKAIKRKYDTRVTAAANLYRKAIMLDRKWREIEERMPNISVSWVLVDVEDPSKGLAPRDKCIRLSLLVNGNVTTFKDVTINDFLGYWVDTAIEKGGKLSDLINSSVPEDRTMAGQGGAVTSKITPAKFGDTTVEYARFVSNPATWGAFLAELAKPANAELTDHVLVSMTEILGRVSDFLREPVIAKRLKAIEKAELAREAAEKAAADKRAAELLASRG